MSMMEIFIRPATLDDLDHLLHHRRAMFEEIGFTDPAVLAQVDALSREYLCEALPIGNYKAWLALRDEEVVAGGGIVLAAWPGYPGESLPRRAWILNMYTEPSARRLGLARKLMQVMLDWCRANNFRSVHLPASPFGRPLYQSLGFQPTNEMTLHLD
jgi:GNAT superfamily N-acetyltransferase